MIHCAMKDYFPFLYPSFSSQVKILHLVKHLKTVFELLRTSIINISEGFPGGSDGKESTSNAGDLGSIPGSGRYPGEGNGNPLQYSCLENPMDGEAW